MTKHTVTVDGKTVEVGSAEDVKKVNAWLDGIANDNRAMADKKAAHDALMASKDREIADKQAEIAKLLQQDRDTRQLVITLSDLKLKCKDRLGVDPVGLTVVDMKRDALRKKIGDAQVAGKDNAYIEARFDMVLEASAMASTDTFRDALKGGLQQATDFGRAAADKAYQDYVESLTSGYRNRD